jgi:hypothetical protein
MPRLSVGGRRRASCGASTDRGIPATRRARDAPSMRQTRDEGAPGLLAMFVAGTLTVIGAVVAIGRIDSDWADLGAVALVLAVLAVLMITIAGQLGDDDNDP